MRWLFYCFEINHYLNNQNFEYYLLSIIFTALPLIAFLDDKIDIINEDIIKTKNKVPTNAKDNINKVILIYEFNIVKITDKQRMVNKNSIKLITNVCVKIIKEIDIFDTPIAFKIPKSFSIDLTFA